MNDGVTVWPGALGRLLVFLGLLVCVSGCVTTPKGGEVSSQDCAVLWDSLDGVLDRAGVSDGYGVPVTGFDYLHSDRFLFALGQTADSSRKQKVLLEKMRMLGLQQRYKALAFLSDEDWAELSRLGFPLDEGFLKRQLSQCSVQLMQKDRQNPAYFNLVLAGIDLDQDYSSLNRVLGLYPLAALITGHGGMEDDLDLFLETGAGADENGAYIEPPLGRKLSAKRIQKMLRNSRLKPFLDFNFSEGHTLDLIHYYAPSFELGDTSFGRVFPADDGGWQVDQQDPVVYYYLSQAMVQGIPALQLNYVIWFNETGKPAPWYRRGKLGGMTIRLTLDWQGRPLVYDLIENSGRFYFGLYNSDVAEIKASGDGYKPNIVGAFGGTDPARHFNVKVEAGSHVARAVSFKPLTVESSRYRLQAYETLGQQSEGLPLPFFNRYGIVEGTGRFEDYLLFSMGIPDVSAMRQRGHQPISLIGRAYFDDPYLFNSIVLVKESLPGKKALLKTGKKRGWSLKQRVESSKSMGKTGRSPKEKYFRSRGLDM